MIGRGCSGCPHPAATRQMYKRMESTPFLNSSCFRNHTENRRFRLDTVSSYAAAAAALGSARSRSHAAAFNFWSRPFPLQLRFSLHSTSHPPTACNPRQNGCYRCFLLRSGRQARGCSPHPARCPLRPSRRGRRRPAEADPRREGHQVGPAELPPRTHRIGNQISHQAIRTSSVYAWC